MKTAAVILLSFIVGALVMRQWLSNRSATGEHAGAKPAEPAAVEAHGGEPDDPLKLTAAVQERIGLQVAVVAAETVPGETAAFGRVLDPAPLLAAASELEIAEAAAAASEKEWTRTKALFAQDQNASARALEQAEANSRRDTALLSGLRTRIATGWCSELGRAPDFQDLIRRLTAQQAALIRLDIPTDATPATAPASARVVPAGSAQSPVEVRILGRALTTDPQLQGIGFIALMETNVPAAGTPLTGWLTGTRPTVTGVFLPGFAVLRVEGGAVVFVRKDAEHFQKRPVILDRPWKDGWLVESGLKAGESVVVTGAQQLLSAGLKTASPE